jgi:hypothetical protein
MRERILLGIESDLRFLESALFTPAPTNLAIEVYAYVRSFTPQPAATHILGHAGAFSLDNGGHAQTGCAGGEP